MPKSLIILIAFGLSWLIAQAIKFILFITKSKKSHSFKECAHEFLKSGGMPSGHTASFTAATMMVGFIAGFDATIFGLAICVLAIVVHDSVKVRYAVGEQGKILNKLIKNQIKVIEGHTLSEVVVGAGIGLAVSIVMSLFL